MVVNLLSFGGGGGKEVCAIDVVGFLFLSSLVLVECIYVSGYFTAVALRRWGGGGGKDDR